MVQSQEMKQKRILLIIAGIVLVAGLAAGAYFFLGQSDKVERTYYENGQIKTAKKYRNGQVSSEAWFSADGQAHREDDLPAQIFYYENGRVSSEIWYLNGQAHREDDLPAVIHYDENGQVWSESWYLNGELIKQ